MEQLLFAAIATWIIVVGFHAYECVSAELEDERFRALIEKHGEAFDDISAAFARFGAACKEGELYT